MIKAILLLLPSVIALCVPLYNHIDPRLFGFPFFYWFQLIWMPVVMVLCYVAYLLMRTSPATAGHADNAPATDTEGAK